MTEHSFSIFADEAAQWIEHEQAGGEFVLILSLSTGSTRCIGPIGSLIDAMAAGATASATLDPGELALAVSVAPLFSLEDAL